MSTKADINPAQLADLSALADGTLDPARRDAVEAQIAASPELTELYERELQAVGALQMAARTDRAPASLRARIEAQRPARREQARRRVLWAGGLAGALAAIALALVLILPAGTPGAPSVSQAALLAYRGADTPAPPPEPGDPSKLDTAVNSLYFPNWGKSFGWRAVGQRTDRINGRLAVTVYYRWNRQEIAYTIVDMPPLKQPAGRITRDNGTELRTLRVGRLLVVTWRQSNHTCVLSAVHGVPAGTLRHLAAWGA